MNLKWITMIGLVKVKIINTPIGTAILWDMQESIEVPENHGVITFGRCDRALYAQKILSLSADWIADYSPKIKMAIVFSPGAYEDWRFAIELPEQPTICPSCGHDEARSRGLNWQCKKCDRQYRKESGSWGGVRSGSGRKKKPKEK